MSSHILIRCDATKAVALGHLRRCISLAKAISEFTNVSVGFGCYDDVAAQNLLSAVGCSKYWLPERVGNMGDIKETIRIASDMGAGSILLDSYDVSSHYFAAMREAGLRTIYFEDMLNTDCLADIVINGLIGAEKLNYSSPHAFLGLRYLVLGPEYWDVSSKPTRKPEPFEILITTGGIDHYNLSTRILKLLNRFQEPVCIHVIIGEYFDNTSNIENAARSSPHKVKLHRQPDGIANIIKDCQIAISAGGLTLYELAAFGIATVGIWLWENQRENVERLGREKVILPIAYKENVDVDEEMFKAIESLMMNDKKRQVMGAKGQHLVDGNGSRRLADALVQFTNK